MKKGNRESSFANVRRTPVDQTGVAERVARLFSRSIKNPLKQEWLRLALSMIDLTTLEGKDTAGKVEQMCRKAMHPLRDEDLHVAAVCVYANHVATAKRVLADSGVLTASVATAFPSGNADPGVKSDEVRRAVGDGADEIDMVISRGAYLSGNYGFVADEIATVKSLCGKARLKVILETGELGTLENIRHASDLAIAAGADFIKTSTGKVQPAATPEVTLVMLEAINDHYLSTGKMTGMKPAGGISTSKVALQYLVMVNEILGERWMTNQWFRFGASSLANDIVLQIEKEKAGYYQSKDYISLD